MSFFEKYTLQMASLYLYLLLLRKAFIQIAGSCRDSSIESASVATPRDELLLDGEWESEERNRPRKKARTGVLDTDLSMSLQAPELSFEEPERATARLHTLFRARFCRQGMRWETGVQ